MMVDVDYECCIGCGACAELCPDVFEMDDRTDKAGVIIFEVTDKNCIEEAISICPGRVHILEGLIPASLRLARYSCRTEKDPYPRKFCVRFWSLEIINRNATVTLS